MPAGNRPDRDPPLVDIRDAIVWRGGTRVFRGFSLCIHRGEQVAVLGPNGSGKTTLLKLISRELYPVAAAGSHVRILGREDWNVQALRSRMGIVSHDLQVRYRARATALEVVLSGFFSSIGVHGPLARKIGAEKRQRARAVLSELGMQELADRPYGDLSAGQQRRCLLARALIHDPDTLILDEPTSGLDLAASFDYLARIREAIAGGRSIVLVTHQLGEIPPEIERVVLLREGRIVADGSKRDVLTAANLERSYGVPVSLRLEAGYYFAAPAPAVDTSKRDEIGCSMGTSRLESRTTPRKTS